MIVKFDVRLETNPAVEMEKAFHTVPAILQRQTGEHLLNIIDEGKATTKLRSRTKVELSRLMERKRQKNLTKDFNFSSISDSPLTRGTSNANIPMTSRAKSPILLFIIMTLLLLPFVFGHEMIACIRKNFNF